jgi:glycosyltransferase involved in cell wall biosynthesis
VNEKPIFVIWKVYQRRAESLATKLGLNVIYYHLPWEERSKAHKLVSYFFKLVRTATDLVHYKPKILFVQLPPSPLLYLIALYSRFSGCKFIADCHNAMIDGPWIKFPFAVASLKKAQCVLVHNPDIANMAREYGLNVVVSRDQLPDVPKYADEQVLDTFNLKKGQYIIVPWNFASDEPIREFAECAQALPDVQFVATWFKERLDSELLNAMPKNVHFTGFLEVDIFNQLFHHAGAALSLTIREGTQPSAASEAIAFGIPVVVSDLQTTRRLYGDKVIFVRNEPQSIADGLTQALSDPVWREKIKELRLEFDKQLQEEVDDLRTVLKGIHPYPSRC